MSLEIYKTLHLLGLMMLFLGLGGALMANSTTVVVKTKVKVISSATHGVGLLLLIISGFGMAARLGIMSGLPGWIYTIIFIWLLFGGAIVLAKRKANMTLVLTLLFCGLGFLAAYLGVLKPY